MVTSKIITKINRLFKSLKYYFQNFSNQEEFIKREHDPLKDLYDLKIGPHYFVQRGNYESRNY